MRFDTAPEIAKHIFPRIVKRCEEGYREHGNTWRDGRYGALAHLGCGGSTARLTTIDVARKLDAYCETGDLTQLEDAIVYAILEYGRRLNAEEEK